MSEEKSVEDYLDEAVAARSPETPAEDEGKSATPDTGKDTAGQADDEGEEQAAAASEESDDSQDGDLDDSDGDSDEPKPKPVSKAQKRIRKLVRERDEANARLAEREAELRVLIAQAGNGQQQQPAPEVDQEDARPKQDDYQDYSQFLADVAAWAGRMEAKKAVSEAQDKSRQRAQEIRAEEAHNARVAKKEVLFAHGEDAFEDFVEVAGNSKLPISEAMTDALLESEEGHKVLYHLGQNPDEAKRIAELRSGAAQVRELVKLEMSLTKPATPAKKTTSASAPIKPVKGSGSTRKFDPDNCSMDEYMRDFAQRRQEGRL